MREKQETGVKSQGVTTRKSETIEIFYESP